MLRTLPSDWLAPPMDPQATSQVQLCLPLSTHGCSHLTSTYLCSIAWWLEPLRLQPTWLHKQKRMPQSTGLSTEASFYKCFLYTAPILIETQMDRATCNPATFSDFNLLNKTKNHLRRTLLCGLYCPLLLWPLGVHSLGSWTVLSIMPRTGGYNKFGSGNSELFLHMSDTTEGAKDLKNIPTPVPLLKTLVWWRTREFQACTERTSKITGVSGRVLLHLCRSQRPQTQLLRRPFFPPIAQEKADTAVPCDYYCRRVFINANLCLLKEILLHKNLFWKSSFKIFISGWFLQACLPKNVTYLYTYACICLQ